MAGMDVQIRFATTADGVSIAYGEAGEGTPFVSVSPPPWSNIEVEWQRRKPSPPMTTASKRSRKMRRVLRDAVQLAQRWTNWIEQRLLNMGRPLKRLPTI